MLLCIIKFCVTGAIKYFGISVTQKSIKCYCTLFQSHQIRRGRTQGEKRMFSSWWHKYYITLTSFKPFQESSVTVQLSDLPDHHKQGKTNTLRCSKMTLAQTKRHWWWKKMYLCHHTSLLLSAVSMAGVSNRKLHHRFFVICRHCSSSVLLLLYFHTMMTGWDYYIHFLASSGLFSFNHSWCYRV